MSLEKLPQLHLLGKLFRQDDHSAAGIVVSASQHNRWETGDGRRELWFASILSILVLAILLPSCLLAFLPSVAQATSGVNNTINVQGKVTNSNGTNVTDGLYDMVFKLYNGADGTATNTYTESWTVATLFSQAAASVTVGGSNTTITYSSDTNESSLKPGQFLWDATKVEAAKIVSVNTSGTGGSIVISTPQQSWAASDTITNRIYVKDGIFQVALNSLNQDANWGTTDFTQDTIYLGINFNSDGEMKPRSQFSSVPYAFRAKSAQTVDGLTIASGKSLTINNTISFSGTDSTSFTLPTASDTLVGLAASQALTNKTVNGLSITSTTGTLTIASGKTLTANNSVSLSGTDGIAVNFGGNNLTLTTSGATSLTLPTSGTVCVTSTGCNQANTNTGSGSAGQITYYTGTNTQAGSNSLFWATGTSRLGVNTAGAPGATLDVSSSETTANAAQINANSLTTGLGLSIASTSTAMTTGGLLGLSWTPGSATTMTGDLFSINVGPNGTVGNILNLMNDGLSVFSVSQNLITANVPVAFNAPGDFNLANGLYFSNTTQANISSAAPIQITAGEAFNSSNLTLSTYNNGMVVLDTATTTTNGKLGIGTSSPTGQLHIKGTLSTALSGTIAVTNASAAVTGTSTSFTTALNVGDAIGINGVAYTISSITDNTHLTLTATYAGSTASGLTAYSDGTALAIDNGAGTNNLTFTKSGRLGIGTNNPSQGITVVGNALISGNSNKLYLADGSHYLTYDGSNLQIQSAAGGINMATSTSAPITFGINGSEQMRVDTSGNIGIGVTTGITSKLTFAASAVASGGILFGTDTTLYRAGANSLQTDGLFVSGVGLTAGSSAYATRASGDTNSRLYILNTGGLNWGPGNAGADTDLYRASAGVLKTDTAFQASTLNGLSITNNGSNTLNIAAGKTLTVSNTLTMTGTDGSSVNFGTGGTVCYTATGCNAANTNTGSGTAGQITFYTGTNTQSSDSNLVWDNSNKRLGVGATPLSKVDINGGVAIGSYAGTSAAPSNGLIVSGKVGIGASNPAQALSVLGNINLATLPTPAAPSAAINATAGNLNGTYKYQVTFVSANGAESAPSPKTAAVAPASQQVNLTSIPTDVTGQATARKIYRTIAGGYYTKYVATISDNVTTTYTDNLTDGSLGAENSGDVVASGSLMLGGSSILTVNSNTDNIALGISAMPNIKNGFDNIAIGKMALNLATDGSQDNIAIGPFALQNSTGLSSVAIGYNSQSASGSSGSQNTSLGMGAMEGGTGGIDGSYNVGIGDYALDGLTTGSSNAALGSSALCSMASGSNNVGLGAATGCLNTSGSGNVFLGYYAGYNETGSNKLYIANSNTSSPLIYGDFSAGSLTFNGNVTLGSGKTIQGLSVTNNGTNTLNIAAGKTLTASNTLTLTGTDGSSVNFGGGGTVCYTSSGCNAANTNTGAGSAGQVAFYTGTNIQSSDSNLVWDNSNKRLGVGTTPSQALDINGKIAINGTVIANLPNQTNFAGTLIIGNGGGSLSHTSGVQGQSNTFAGIGSGLATTTGNANTALGYNSLSSNTTGYLNTAVGSSALTANTTGYGNVAIGESSLKVNITGGANVSIGQGALVANTGGSDNLALGFGVLESNTTGSGNVALGENALDVLKPSGAITAFAANGGNTTVTSAGHGLSNGQSITISGTTSYNGTFTISNVTASTFDIARAFVANDATGTWDGGTSGSLGWGNVAIGYRAGYNNKVGSDNIFIGDNAGFSETGSNKLYIANSGTSTPLIYGDFAAGSLTFNGNVTVASGKTINGLTITSTGTKTLTIANGKTLTANSSLTLAGADSKTLTVNNTLTFGGTDGSSVAFGSGGTVCYTSSGCNAANTNTGSGSSGQITFYTGANTQSGDSNLYWDNTNKRLGVGTSSPNSVLNAKGTVNVALSGTVAVTNGSPNVTGTSTTFTSQIEAGSAIMISGTAYTVSSVTDNTHLVLTANFSGTTASGLTAYKDPNLFEVDNGAGTAMSYVDRTGAFYINNTIYAASGGNLGLRLSTNTGTQYAMTIRRSDLGSGSDINFINNSGTYQIMDSGGSNTNFSISQAGLGSIRAGMVYSGASSPGVSAAGTGRIYYDSATNRFMASENGGAYINLLGGYNKIITLSPEYAGAVLTADDGTNTNGSMTSDNMLNSGSVGWQSYYQWTSTQATLQDYTVMVRVTLPQDFGSWQTGTCPGSTCALEIGYQTGVSGTTNNAVSARVNNASNTPGTVICTIADASSTTWSSFGCTSTTLATSPTWNTAGDTAVIRIKLKANSTASALARAGDITLRYVSKF